MQVLDGSTAAVHVISFSPDGRFVVAGAANGIVHLWGWADTRTEERWTLPITALEFSPSGDRLVVANLNAWGVHQLDDPARPRLYPPHSKPHLPVAAVRLVSAERLVVGRGSRAQPGGGCLELWNIEAMKIHSTPFSTPQGVRSVSAVGERVAWSEWGRLIYVWDIRKPDRVKLPLAAEALCVALSPDGLQVAAGLDNYKVKLFDVARKQERRSLDGHTGRVTGVAFTPDGGTVVSGSWDGTVRLWDADAGTPRATFRWPVGKQVTSLAVSPDGLRLAVGGDTGAVVLADLD